MFSITSHTIVNRPSLLAMLVLLNPRPHSMSACTATNPDWFPGHSDASLHLCSPTIDFTTGIMDPAQDMQVALAERRYPGIKTLACVITNVVLAFKYYSY
jgi:hypothetical protein